MTAASFEPDDPRSAMPSPAGSPGVAGTARPVPQVFELSDKTADVTSEAGSRTWYVRAQNFCVGVTDLAAGDTLAEVDIPDDYLVLVCTTDAVATVHGADEPVSVTGPGLIIVAPGTSAVSADRRCTVVRIFSGHVADVMSRARNHRVYEIIDPAVATLAPVPERAEHSRTHAFHLADIPDAPGRFGRILRSSSLMINWFPLQMGPRSEDHLSPHVHDDFEQASLALVGDYVHHFRSPWTPRLREWRPDEHRACSSPSIAIIPAGVIHTTRAVGPGDHQLIDIFAPPRADFASQGWVINDAEYDGADPRHEAGLQRQTTS